MIGAAEELGHRAAVSSPPLCVVVDVPADRLPHQFGTTSQEPGMVAGAE
jgi:hypothetical protein